MNIEMEHNICRLCLKVERNEFEEIDDTMKKMLDILLLKLDLDIIKDPIICQNCIEVAKRYLYFKYVCLHTEQIILSYSVGKETAKNSIMVMHSGRKGVQMVDEDLNICRICMARLKRIDFMCLNTLMNLNVFQMLPEYMPEMDFTMLDNPIICATCREDLHGYLKFSLNCLEIEDNIKARFREEGTDIVGQAKLSSILHPSLKDILKYPAECPQESVIKEDLNTFENTGVETYSELTKPEEEFDIKEDYITLKENSDESPSVMNVDKRNVFHAEEYSTETKLDMISLQDHKRKSNIDENITLIQKDSLYLESFLSDRKDASKMKTNSSLSAYNAKHKSLKRYNHKKGSETKTYKCAVCAYEFKKKSCLKSHMLVHKNISEIEMYTCFLCGHASKYKSSLKTHMLLHKDISEIKMYKCSFCAYKTKYKSGLRTHNILIHKDVSEIKMNKCSLCPYETKLKGSLRLHMLVHKNISEVKTYKCAMCTYEAKRKGMLKSHILIHKGNSQLNTFKCSLCSYKAKRKCNLEVHMLTRHKGASEIKM